MTLFDLSLDLSDPLVTDAVRLIHLCAMAVAIGSIAATHASTLKSLRAPLDQAKLDQLDGIHHLVKLALMGLWLSGAALIWIRTGFEMANFSPKLWMKVMVVTVLTVTAGAMQVSVFPLLRARLGLSLMALARRDRLVLAFFVGLSAAGWLSAVLLGAVRIFKTMDWPTLLAVFGGLHVMAVAGLMVPAVVCPRLASAPETAAERPALA
ncbi:MAG: hypothetical protein AAGK00_18720 [Pseudomonadota bacterium]